MLSGLCVCDAVRLYISSLHNSTCPFFFGSGLTRKCSVWFCHLGCCLAAHSCRGNAGKSLFPKPRGFFLPAPRRKHAPTFCSAAFLYSAYKGRLLVSAEVHRQWGRSGAGAEGPSSGSFPSAGSPCRALRTRWMPECLPLHLLWDHPQVLLVQSVKKWAQDSPPPSTPRCYKAILCCGAAHQLVTGWDGAAPSQAVDHLVPRLLCWFTASIRRPLLPPPREEVMWLPAFVPVCLQNNFLLNVILNQFSEYWV